MEHVSDQIAKLASRTAKRKHTPTVSAVLPDGTLLELVYEPERAVTAFARWHEGSWDLIPDYEFPDGRRLIPYSPQNNLLVHGVVRVPSGPVEYGTERELVASVQSFINQYVAVSPRFERLAAYYVLLTWIFDAFNELPYLRVRGDPGCGKTRFLLTVGSLSYKPIFASGASTVSPLFRILDAFKGTLVIDESDFRVSDERAQIVKILNNGNARGFPVLRTESVPGTREFSPRAYHVFGPKLVATRSFFDDPALESRFLSEHMESQHLRRDIPINLPREHDEEALQLRNQLLLFRFRNRSRGRDLAGLVDRQLEPRLAQIFTPLLSVMEDEETRQELRGLARSYHQEMAVDRGSGIEAELLEVIGELWRRDREPVSVRDIAGRFGERFGSHYPDLTPKRIGWLVRKKLRFVTCKRNGVYVIASEQEPRLRTLLERYGLVDERDEASPVRSP